MVSCLHYSTVLAKLKLNLALALRISKLVPLPVILDIFFVQCGLESGTREKMVKKQKVMQVTKGNFFFLWLGSLGQNGSKRAKRGAKLDKGCNQGRSSHSRTKPASEWG
jgi:hypothetical protein